MFRTSPVVSFRVTVKLWVLREGLNVYLAHRFSDKTLSGRIMMFWPPVSVMAFTPVSLCITYISFP